MMRMDLGIFGGFVIFVLCGIGLGVGFVFECVVSVVIVL